MSSFSGFTDMRIVYSVLIESTGFTCLQRCSSPLLILNKRKEYFHSVLIESTGLASDALTDWYEIVAYPIKKTTIIEKIKVNAFIPVLYAKVFSHLLSI